MPAARGALWKKPHIVTTYGVINKPGLVGAVAARRDPSAASRGLYLTGDTIRSRGIGVDKAARTGITTAEAVLGPPAGALRGHVCATEAEPRRHLARDQLELARLVAERPQVDAPAPGLGVAREELGAVLARADADLATELVGIAPQRSQDAGEHAIGLGPVARDPCPHRHQRVRERLPRAAARRARPAANRSGVVL